MGTNYYAVMDEREIVCPHCDRPGYREFTRWHIGKSSGGWCFTLHVGSPEEPHIPKNLEEWKKAWERAMHLEDEYGMPLPISAMLDVITKRRWSERERDPEWYRSNHAIPGPNNLVRHELGNGCIGHGDGTYDLIVGRFS